MMLTPVVHILQDYTKPVAGGSASAVVGGYPERGRSHMKHRREQKLEVITPPVVLRIMYCLQNTEAGGHYTLH
jgi:hypothetical protein